jgi:hypothetical protein
MRPAWLTEGATLAERFAKPGQVAPEAPASELPPYLESFLAHLRLLVGVPFEYLVPDERLLPAESIRFFYVDRSFTDRLVDGALAVGKIGTREQAHHQAQAPSIQATLDRTERVVRALQRRTLSFENARAASRNDGVQAELTTGFVLRSRLVDDWPHLEVVAFGGGEENRRPLRTLRLERLSASVLIALFEGVPSLVHLEEPHHGVQLGVFAGGARPELLVRRADGQAIPGAPRVEVPLRAGAAQVVHVAELRRRLHARHIASPDVPPQSGSAALSVQLLAPPFRQRFEGSGGRPSAGAGGFVPVVTVSARVGEPQLLSAIEELGR